jgi:hypothetical protein
VNGIFQSAEGGSLARDVSYKGDVKKALEQAELKDVTVSEDQDKNTITKAKAADVLRRRRLHG